jgi:hypothetical protein
MFCEHDVVKVKHGVPAGELPEIVGRAIDGAAGRNVGNNRHSLRQRLGDQGLTMSSSSLRTAQHLA